MNPRRKIIGVPIILWIIVAATIGTVVTATILSSILNHQNPQVTITWNQRIPSNTRATQSYNWSINVQSSQTYNIAHFQFYLTAPAQLTDHIMNIAIMSGGSELNQTLVNQLFSDGRLSADAVVPIQTGSNDITGSWKFTSTAPLTTYTIQAFVIPTLIGTYSSNIINETTTLTT